MRIFSKIHHVCIIVREIEKAAAYYSSLGIGPWRDLVSPNEFAALNVPNPAAFPGLLYKYANLSNIQIQLCQPGPLDSPQRRFLDTRGEGVFHLGFEVENCDEGEAEAVKNGLSVLMSGRRDDRSGFTYFDTRSAAGVVLEIRSSPGAHDAGA